MGNVPYYRVKAFVTAVKMIRAVIFGQDVLLAVQSEFSSGDPISITPDSRTKIFFTGIQITIQIVITQNDIFKVPVLIRYCQGYNLSAKVGQIGRAHV